MKKVLFITYAWPPKGGVGVIRALKFAKYLPRFGWMPIIITTDDTAVGTPYRGEDVGIDITSYRVIRTEYRELLKGLPQRLRENILMPDTKRGWLGPSLKDISGLLEQENFDLVFSTSPPETSHLIGRMIKKNFSIPWIADFRDLWSMYHFEKENFLRHMFSTAMERNILKDADILVTVSDAWARDLAGVNKTVSNRIRVVTNGFDDEDFKDTPIRNPEKFTLTYTGKLHEKMQNPEILFKVVSDCIKEGLIDRKRISLRFYTLGFKKADIESIAHKYSLGDVSEEYHGATYKDSLNAQMNSTLLLFFQWKGAKGWYSAKIFEYLGSKKPILALAEKDSVVNDLILGLNAGFVVNSYDELKDILLKCYNEYLKKGVVDCRIDEEKLKRYRRIEITKSLAEIFNEVVAKSRI